MTTLRELTPFEKENLFKFVENNHNSEYSNTSLAIQAIESGVVGFDYNYHTLSTDIENIKETITCSKLDQEFKLDEE